MGCLQEHCYWDQFAAAFLFAMDFMFVQSSDRLFVDGDRLLVLVIDVLSVGMDFLSMGTGLLSLVEMTHIWHVTNDNVASYCYHGTGPYTQARMHDLKNQDSSCHSMVHLLLVVGPPL